MANELYFLRSDNAYNIDQGGGTSGNTFSICGRLYFVDGQHSADGALRFTNINIAQGTTVNSATLHIYQNSGVSGSSEMKMKVWGIDEDNTGSFSSNPFGRSKTTANNTHTRTPPGGGEYFEIGVTNCVNEILARGGWNSGNAMGFIFEDNGTINDDCYVYDDSNNSYLDIRVNAEPNFKPTPKSIAAPTFPDAQSYGIRISEPGVDVRTATESQLFFTTRKKEFKVIDEAEITTSSTSHNVAHNLSYAPAAMVYATSGGKRIKLNRIFSPNYVDPIGGVEGKFGCNQTNLNIATSNGIQVYYYIFIDELE